MNPMMISSLVDSRCQEIRAEAARGPRPAHRARHGFRLRRRFGYALVEAGLHLLAAPAGRP
jgi:hypothetical protein